ncbi:MAG: type II secretion system F family protein [Limnohabitans sp.]
MKPNPTGQPYRWQGLDTQGQSQQGLMYAHNAPLALAQLRRNGIAVQKLRRQWWARGSRISPSLLASTTRQWTTLLQAGVSMVPALKMLHRSATHSGMAALLAKVRHDVESGMSLSQALELHPEHISPLYVSLVQAGEAAGILDTMLERLSSTLEKNEMLHARVRAALTYPGVVIVIALAVLALILLYVVPVFEEVFRAFGAQLPLSTRLVLGLSDALRHGAPWMAMLALPVALLLLRQKEQQVRWRRWWHRQVLDWPGVGPLVRTSVVARWAHTLSALLAAGVPLTEALPVAGKASDHPVYERMTWHLQRRVAEGGKLSDGMAHTGRFPDMLLQMCATGEESGTLEVLLGKAASLMAEELDRQINAISSLIEPLIIVVLGGAIGVILVAMYLPIFRLGEVF